MNFLETIISRIVFVEIMKLGWCNVGKIVVNGVIENVILIFNAIYECNWKICYNFMSIVSVDDNQDSKESV